MDAYGEKLLRQGAEKERKEILIELDMALRYAHGRPSPTHVDGIEYAIQVIKSRGEKEPESSGPGFHWNADVQMYCPNIRKPEKIEFLEVFEFPGCEVLANKINEISSALNDMMARMGIGR